MATGIATGIIVVRGIDNMSTPISRAFSRVNAEVARSKATINSNLSLHETYGNRILEINRKIADDEASLQNKIRKLQEKRTNESINLTKRQLDIESKIRD